MKKENVAFRNKMHDQHDTIDNGLMMNSSVSLAGETFQTR